MAGTIEEEEEKTNNAMSRDTLSYAKRHYKLKGSVLWLLLSQATDAGAILEDNLLQLVVCYAERRYVPLIEYSNKEHETYQDFLQVDGNEDALEDLKEKLSYCCRDVEGDMSAFTLHLDTLIPESVVDSARPYLNYNSFRAGHKLSGAMSNTILASAGLVRPHPDLLQFALYRTNSERVDAVLCCGQIKDHFEERRQAKAAAWQSIMARCSGS
jgi:hypothetical protein